MNLDHTILEEACNAIGKGSTLEAKNIITNKLPFVLMNKADRKYTDFQKTEIFRRDGFIDRYSGQELVFPPVLRILSNIMPEEFPFHPNWKVSECHIAYWQLMPTIDHVVPVSRGGSDEESNWVCTSQLRNGAKSNWLLSELDWTLREPGDLANWDGLFGWFMWYVGEHPRCLEDQYINSWFKAAKRVS